MIFSTVKVKDFDQFFKIFTTKGAAKRKEHGSRGATVYRDAEDPTRVYVIFDWDEEGFKKFMADPEAPGIMSEAGLEGPPQPTYVELAGQVDS